MLIAGLLRRYRGRFITGSLLLLLTNGLALLIPLILKEVVESLRLRPTTADAGRFALLMVVVATAQVMVRTGSRLAILGASRRIAFDLRNRFYAHLQRLPVSFYSVHTTGDLMSRAINDMMSVRSFFGPGLLNLANTAIIYVAGIALMIWISPALTAAALLPLPLLLLTVQRVSRQLYGRSRQVQERLAQVSERVQENLNGIHMIKTYAQEHREAEKFRSLADAYRRDTLALARVRGILVPLMGSMGGVSILLALWVGGGLVARGSLTLGEFVAFSGYLALLVWPTVAMGWVINSFQRGLVAMRRLQEILDQPGEDEGRVADSRIQDLGGAIEFRRLTVAHEEGASPALVDLELNIAAGETLALVGPVGAGKSTLANVLARFVRVPDGKVFIDGHDLNTIPLEVLRGAIGYAPQEAFLFSRSLRENIAFGLDEPLPDAVEQAALVSGLGRDLATFPDGLMTRVGEGGQTLSGGQRQRAALARALVLAPRILILDDSLSSVDADTERTILGGLTGAARQRTTLLISHRLGAVTWADRIAVLDAGRLCEIGSHQELLRAGGLYANLYRRQSMEGEMQAQE